jgi:hypothetical protein
MFSYIHKGHTHTNVTMEYMRGIGMTDEQIDSVLRQKEFEGGNVQTLRQQTYRQESDPLYMEWQYDQTEESRQLWVDKVEEIKARYPLPA